MKPEYKPLYVQVMESIRNRIQQDEYDVDVALPSESEFAQEFKVSISTVRQAISILVNDNMLVKKQGRGTFISKQVKRLTFLTWLTETPKSRMILNNLITLIEGKFPNVEIEVIPTSYLEAKEELERLIASGRAPDIAHIVSHWTGAFASRGAFADLEKLLPEDSLACRSEESDLRGGRFDGSLCSISWGLCPITMIANMDILKKYGIDDIPEIMTFDEWDEICKDIYTKSDGEIYAYGMPYDDGEADFLRLYHFMQAFGGEFATLEGEVVLRSVENVQAFKWMKDFAADGKVYFDSIINIRKKFADDTIAFMHDGPWAKMWLSEMVGGSFEEKFKAVLNPVASHAGKKEDCVSKSWNYNHALAVLTQSDNAGLAAKVIDALTVDPEISTYYYKNSGHLPVSVAMDIDTIDKSDFYRMYYKQLRGASLINAENVLFPKAMDFCVDAVHNIFRQDVNVARELAEKQHYLEILYDY